MSQGILGFPGNTKSLGQDQCSITNGAAVGINATSMAVLGIPNGIGYAMIQADSQNVRWRDDGTDPTTTKGMILSAGSTLQYTGDLTKIKFIATATTTNLNVSFYGKS